MPRGVPVVPGPTWFGLGTPVRERRIPDTDVDWEELHRRLSDTTPARAAAVLRMATATGGKLPGVTRRLANFARHDLAAHGYALPPWWRLRLARRTAMQAGLPDPVEPPTPGDS